MTLAPGIGYQYEMAHKEREDRIGVSRGRARGREREGFARERIERGALCERGLREGY